jgi:hypothetical protein
MHIAIRQTSWNTTPNAWIKNRPTTAVFLFLNLAKIFEKFW